ncbi:MAG: hypothetical protein KGP12_08800 [Actinomycetales bacterium]|nr:hypothetical protein [Actinomycetales bacterium]
MADVEAVRLVLRASQCDILLGAVSRVVGDDGYAPDRWQALDEHQAVLAPARAAGPALMPALRVAAGRALVMVCTHDCGLDEEFNAVVDELIKPTDWERIDERTAQSMAKARDGFDRSFAVSPLGDPSTVLVAGRPVDRGLLMGGHNVCFLPVPELRVGDAVMVPEPVVDLTYRSTLDRPAFTQRITCISEPAMEPLGFALARLDVLRTPSLEVQLSVAVGQQITSAKVSRSNPLLVDLTLADGSRIELLK